MSIERPDFGADNKFVNSRLLDTVANNMSDEHSPKYWAECGLPDEIAEYVSNFAKTATTQDHPVLQRARRFRAYWEQHPDDDAVRKNWDRLKMSVVNQQDALVGLFLIWPDAPMRQPLGGLYSPRRIGLLELTVDRERDEYKRISTHVTELVKFLRGKCDAPTYRHLIQDASATGEGAIEKATQVQKLNLANDLFLLAELLDSVDPAAKYPHKHADGNDAALRSYRAQLANLNQKLDTPEPTAIANLANINNPDNPVKGYTIGKSWNRSADKKP